MVEQLKHAVEEGFALLKLRPKSKAPVAFDWTNAAHPTYREVKAWLENGFNVGVRLGWPSKLRNGYLHVIDIDIRDAKEREEPRAKLKELFPGVKWPRHPTVQSGSGGESRHVYVVTQKPLRSKKLAHSGRKIIGSDGKEHWSWEIELFGSGKQVVLPPSVHPSGNEYRWLVEPDWRLGIPILDSDLIEAIVNPELNFNDDDSTDESTGLSLKTIKRVLSVLQHWADDHDLWLRVGMALKHELGEEGWEAFDEWSKNGAGYNEKENRARWKSFGRNRFKRPVTMRSLVKAALEIDKHVLEDDEEDLIAEFEDLPPEEPVKLPEGQPDLSILAGPTVPAPEFPLDIFGDHLADFIARQARNVSAPVDYVAAAVLAGASTAIGNSTWVRIKQGYIEPPILWCMVIGPPSSKKSPALNLVTRVLHEIEKDYEPIYAKRLRRWERDKALADMRRKKWEDAARKSLESGKEVPEMPAECFPPPEPYKRQAIISDTTIEAFIAAQQRNPRGFMVFRNELHTWLANMERYSNSSERGAWLESYDGDPITQERIKFERKTEKVYRQFATIIGGIQPDKLLDITARTVADDGLQARFLPFWPELQLYPMSSGIEADPLMKDVFTKLYSVAMDKDDDGHRIPHIVDFTPEAFDHFRDWADRREAAELHTPMRLASAYGKASGHVGRLALILEYLWWACVPDFDEREEPPPAVGVEAVKAAIRFREAYLKHMQRRVFAHATEAPAVTNARLIAEWIVDRKVETLTPREIQRNAGIKGINSHTKVNEINPALEVLEAMRWIYQGPQRKQKRGGRPSKIYHVNPTLWALLENQKAHSLENPTRRPGKRPAVSGRLVEQT